MSAPLVIGLTGYAGSGKDEAARLMMTNNRHVFARVSFADELKSTLRSLGWNGRKDEAGRLLLQDFGMFVRERVHPDAWIRQVANHIAVLQRDGYDIALTDVRFLNEIEFVRRLGGEIWRINRPGVGPVNDHVSEREWTTVEPDRVIENDGDITQLRHRVDAALEQIRSEVVCE